MYLVNLISSQIKSRYRNGPITAQTTSTIPTSARHELAEQIESTIYTSTASPSSTLSSPAQSPPIEISTVSAPAAPITSMQQRRKRKADEQLIKELSKTIDQTEETLRKMKESETFLDVRIRKYRFMLDQQSVRLCSRHLVEGNDHIVPVTPTPGTDTDTATPAPTGSQYIIDVEKEAEIKKQFTRQETNENKLKGVLEVQRSILTEIEVMRRKLIDVQAKRDELIMKQGECEEFLIASAELDFQMQRTGLANGSGRRLNGGTSTGSNTGANYYDYENDDNGTSFVTNEDRKALEMRNLKGRREEDDTSIVEVC